MNLAGFLAVLSRALIHSDEFDELHAHLPRQLRGIAVGFQAADEFFHVCPVLLRVGDPGFCLGDLSFQRNLFFLIFREKVDADFFRDPSDDLVLVCRRDELIQFVQTLLSCVIFRLSADVTVS